MTQDRILSKVCKALDVLISVGERYDGLFPSLLDIKSHDMLSALPAAIPGQRDGDRSHLGSNLVHDQSALLTLYALSSALGRPDYQQAADRYLERFALHCTHTETGLFPWGEHAYWHLVDDTVGNSYLIANPDRPRGAIHDHLRQAPLWLWEKLQGFNPHAVLRFCEGLDFHWQEGAPEEYIRHGHIELSQRPRRGARACDFPRHSGFYIFDWAFGHAQTKRPDFRAQIQRILDYWWEKRDARGLLLIESRSPADDRFHNVNAPGQTVSLAASLFEAETLVVGSHPELASQMRSRAFAYIEGFLHAPNDVNRGTFALLSRREGNELVEHTPIWGSKYGVWPASYIALTVLCAYRYTGDARLLAMAEATGKAYLGTPFPQDVHVPAMDSGLALGLLADLYAISGERAWLDGALRMADTLINIYVQHDLPLGAAGIDWYESQMGTSFLLHGLARTALLAEDRENCPLSADYTAR